MRNWKVQVCGMTPKGLGATFNGIVIPAQNEETAYAVLGLLLKAEAEGAGWKVRRTTARRGETTSLAGQGTGISFTAFVQRTA